MPRLFLLPIGFHENIPYRVLSSWNANMDDVIVVITCEPMVQGVRIAYERLKSQCIASNMAEPKLLNLPCEDPYESIKMIRDEIMKTPRHSIILEIGAGLRILPIYAMIALKIIDKPYTIHYIPEPGTAPQIIITETYIATVTTGITNIEKQVLKIIIENPGITIKEIAQTLNRKEKTIANITTRLKNKNLLTKKKKKLYPTKQAKTILIPDQNRENRDPTIINK